MLSSRLRHSLTVAGTALGITTACSDSATPDNTTAGAGTMTSGSLGAATTDGMTGVQGGATMGTATTGGPVTAAVTTGGTTGSTGAGGASSSVSGTTGGTITGTMGGTMGTGAGGMGMGMGMGTGAGGMSSMGATTGSTGAGGTGSAADDLDMTADQFTCIADWDQVLGFRINNLLGHLDEAIAVAENPNGGVYPVGTILQHLPTEAMVKRKAGFSPETKDWEFFVLTVSQDGTTTIANRGTTEISTMGNTCASCHSLADPEWDFVCNTYGEAARAVSPGDQGCGFDFNAGQLDTQIAADPRCD